jgi:hypothetical protein
MNAAPLPFAPDLAPRFGRPARFARRLPQAGRASQPPPDTTNRSKSTGMAIAATPSSGTVHFLREEAGIPGRDKETQSWDPLQKLHHS